MAGGTYLRRRPQGWVFRCAIPKDLQTRFGRREIVRSLAQVPQSQAALASRHLRFALEELFVRARSDITLTTEQLGSFAWAFGADKRDLLSRWTPPLKLRGRDPQDDYEDFRDVATLCMKAARDRHDIFNADALVSIARRAGIDGEAAEANMPLLQQAAARGTAAYCMKLADDIRPSPRRRLRLPRWMGQPGGDAAEEAFRSLCDAFAKMEPLAVSTKPQGFEDKAAAATWLSDSVSAAAGEPGTCDAAKPAPISSQAGAVVDSKPTMEPQHGRIQGAPVWQKEKIISSALRPGDADKVSNGHKDVADRPMLGLPTSCEPRAPQEICATASTPGAAIRISTLWPAFVTDQIGSGVWSPSRRSELKSTLRIVTRLIGDVALTELTRDLAAECRARYFTLPKDHKNMWLDHQLKRKRSYDEVIAYASSLGKQPRTARLSKKTWNKHCGTLSAYICWIKSTRSDSKDLDEVFLGLSKPVKKSMAEVRLERAMPVTAMLRALFSASIWTGRRAMYHLQMPGPLIIRDSLYWVPLLEVCFGLRREEACQLRVKHFTMKFGYLGIDLFDKKIRVKGDEGASRRWIPLSQAVLDLGIVQCLISGRNLDELLFPELTNENAHNAYGDKVGKRFSNYIKKSKPDFTMAATEAFSKIQVSDEERQLLISQENKRLILEFGEKTTHHGLRHWFKTVAENAGCKTIFVEEIMGHSDPGRKSEGSRYFKEAFIENLKATVDMIPVPFDPLKLRKLAEEAERTQQAAKVGRPTQDLSSAPQQR